MAKQPKKKPKARPGLAQNAFRVVQEATGQAPKTSDPGAGKLPAAVERGQKGGPARASKLPPSARAAIAKKAAARWAKKADRS